MQAGGLRRRCEGVRGGGGGGGGEFDEVGQRGDVRRSWEEVGPCLPPIWCFSPAVTSAWRTQQGLAGCSSSPSSAVAAAPFVPVAMQLIN